MSRLSLKAEVEELWLIIEWKSHNKKELFSLISNQDLVDHLRLADLHTGKVVNVNDKGKVRQASIVMASADKRFLQMEVGHIQEASEQIGLGSKNDPKDNAVNSKSVDIATDSEKEEDFQPSESDWNPISSECDSDDNPKKNRSLHVSRCKKPRLNASSFRNGTRSSTSRLSNGSKHKNNPIAQNCSTPVIQSFMETSYSVKPTAISFSKIRPSSSLSIEGSTNQKHNSLCVDALSYNAKRVQENSIEARSLTPNVPPMTFDQQTQTHSSEIDANVVMALKQNQGLMKNDMIHLFQRIEELTMEVKSLKIAMLKATKNENNSAKDSTMNISNSPVLSETMELSVLQDANLIVNESNTSHDQQKTKSPYSFELSDKEDRENESPIKRDRIVMAEGTEMIPIGSGKTLIASHVFNQVKWTSYSSATRKLLMAVFPRKTLATHSLTGKASPAFSDRVPKMKLDARKISDIIMTVSKNCNVQESLVRGAITTKCSDENKMYRIRMNKKMKNQLKTHHHDSEMN